MSRWSRRLRASAFTSSVVAATATAVLLPAGAAAAAPARAGAIRHATLSAALHRLPDYFPGVVHWRISLSKHYGTTNWNTNTITISALTPPNLLYSVVAHEWSHEIQAYDYHRHFWAIVKSMNRHFGGPGTSGQRGVEYSADCMAILQGATWTHYTSCHNAAWRKDAKRLLRGHRLGTHARPHAAQHKARHTAAHAGQRPTARPSQQAPNAPKPAPAPTAYTVPSPGSPSSGTRSQSPPDAGLPGWFSYPVSSQLPIWLFF